MNSTPPPPINQSALWNGRAARAWIDSQEMLDRLFKAFEDRLVAEASALASPRVLDVGCGTGSTTLAVARMLGAKGHCFGADISEPMIEVARARAEREGNPAHFVCADVQTHAFEPASVDLLTSRFGVMFFPDPVAAFKNLRRAATDYAELRMIVWRSGADNPFMTTAERAAASLLPNIPARKPDGPGQFSFADRGRVWPILNQSGWAHVGMREVDVECVLPEKELMGYISRLGPVGMALQDVDELTRAQVVDVVRTAFEPYVHGDEVRFTAACWMVSARSGRPC
jgi:SAM-dependent methyltransferase